LFSTYLALNCDKNQEKLQDVCHFVADFPVGETTREQNSIAGRQYHKRRWAENLNNQSRTSGQRWAPFRETSNTDNAHKHNFANV
jgi:hypothetical protein